MKVRQIPTQARLSKGVTLVEILLVLGVIAVILAGVGRLYSPTSTSARANEVAQAVNSVRAATNAYVSDKQAFPSNGISDLISNGYLSDTYAKSVGVSGKITLTQGTDKSTYTITVSGIASPALCRIVYSRISGSLSATHGEKAVTVDSQGTPGKDGSLDTSPCSGVIVTYPMD